MATRERKTRNITESPTSTGSTDSVNAASSQKASTPTKAGRGRVRGRGSTRPVSTNDDNESVQSNEEETSGKQTPQRSSSRMSTGSVVKEESDDTNKQEDIKSEKPSPGRTISRRNKVEAAAETFTKRIVRSNSDLIKRSPLLKRKSLPVVSGRGIGRKRGTARHSLGGRPVKSVKENKDEKQKNKVGRRRKTDTLANKKEEIDDIFKKPAEVENHEPENMSESDNLTLRRRRSASKSSETTPNVSDTNDTDGKNDDLTDNVKKEHLDIDELNKKHDILDKMAQNFSESKVSTDETSQTRRSSRPRKSTCKDKDDLVKPIEIKKELKVILYYKYKLFNVKLQLNFPFDRTQNCLQKPQQNWKKLLLK